MEKILIIGAFDRYNYGDLLFPLIIEKQLDTYNKNFQYEFFGIIRSDLTEEGGKPTLDLKAFYEACNNPQQKVSVIVAGGEALGVTWNSLLAALNKPFQRVHKHHVRISNYLDLNFVAKKILKGNTTLPFVFDKDDFKSVNKVILNSLGGSGIKTALFDRYNFMKSKLQKVDYLAVRDKITLGNLKQNDVQAHLFPDSAILMSEFYPLEVLEKSVTKEVLEYVQQNKGEYIFFQINKKTTVGKELLIANELDKIFRQDHTEICLCPIGKALNHDDHEALQAVKQKLESPSTYFDAENIWDIMYLIAHSKAYIGTSLHGAITSMSYAVPHVGLTVEKLDAYLDTWGVKGSSFAVGFSQIYDQYKIATAVKAGELEASRDRQFTEIKKAFDLIVNTLQKP
ncbi:MAG: polysaccharide pyruvyl transferase family protein [Anditalea sp.]